MKGRLTDKVALVTASSRGLGRAIAYRFAQERAAVAINYSSSADAAEQLRKQIETEGGQAVTLQADVSSAERAAALVEAAIAHFGRLDILVNNAGGGRQGDFAKLTEEEYRGVLDLNLTSAIFATQAFVKHVVDAGRGGKVINISSIHEDITFPGYATYCAAKGGLRMLTRDLAVELGPKGITVNSIAPGAFATDANAALLADAPRLESLLKRIPLGRLGRPEEVAGLAAFLASSEADYVTGSTYVIDGGVSVFYEE